MYPEAGDGKECSIIWRRSIQLPGERENLVDGSCKSTDAKASLGKQKPGLPWCNWSSNSQSHRIWRWEHLNKWSSRRASRSNEEDPPLPNVSVSLYGKVVWVSFLLQWSTKPWWGLGEARNRFSQHKSEEGVWDPFPPWTRLWTQQLPAGQLKARHDLSGELLPVPPPQQNSLSVGISLTLLPPFPSLLIVFFLFHSAVLGKQYSSAERR